MATQAEELAELQDLKTRLENLKIAIDALQTAITNAGNTTPEIDQAFQDVRDALTADETDAAPK